MDDLRVMASLTPFQRLTGFFMSLGMGIVFICIAITFVPTIALFPKKFAFFFTCGNFFSVAATSFLVGPQKQLRSMVEAHRAQVAMTYVASTFITLYAALSLQSSVLSITFAVVQIASVVWYGLSYIPFARQVVSTFWGYAWVFIGPALSVVWSLASRLLGLCCRFG